jgi:hypothetical protein
MGADTGPSIAIGACRSEQDRNLTPRIRGIFAASCSARVVARAVIYENVAENIGESTQRFRQPSRRPAGKIRRTGKNYWELVGFLRGKR